MEEELKEALEKNSELIEEFKLAVNRINTSWYMMVFVSILTVIITLRVLGWI